MLENAKSSYFVKIVFSFVDEKQKLKLVKRNKSLQKKIDISIINYLHFKGKYIIYESNGKGKEYDFDNRLIFEGEYLNGKRNGKGKEYDWKGKLEFEGEYLDDKIIIGTKYNKNGDIIHIYNNLNEKRKEYYDNGELLFEGEYLNGKKMEKEKNIMIMVN